MATRSQRADTRIHDLGGTVRNITGAPQLTFTDTTDSSEYKVGALCYSTDRERLYINKDGTINGWRYMTLT